METKIIKLSKKQMDNLPDKVKNKIKGNYALEIDGVIYYGFHSKEDINQALKIQPIVMYLKE